MEPARTSGTAAKLTAMAIVATIFVAGAIVLIVFTAQPMNKPGTSSLETSSSPLNAAAATTAATENPLWQSSTRRHPPTDSRFRRLVEFDHRGRWRGSLGHCLIVQHTRDKYHPYPGFLGGCGPSCSQWQQRVQGRRTSRDAQLCPLSGALHGRQLVPGRRRR